MFESLINNLLFPFFVTIAIETFVAFLFGYRDKFSIGIVILINVITNPAVNYLLLMDRVFHVLPYSLAFIIILELGVVLVEWAILMYSFDNRSKGKLLLLSFIMNLSSFVLGALFFGL